MNEPGVDQRDDYAYGSDKRGQRLHFSNFPSKLSAYQFNSSSSTV
ncbi:hypothetical protein AVDCRST_MAG81-1008 [uncultured Synechococcales cyanobacterium]|uniref:Uncharacterized protein n=1 Tax=uncultured Synechococcales cyanobacterium TaxID=1936017 RepID=A0A6J4V390_9CYAN|nr:hypothetical protein AVDCRST_MAG81-1008 [uncultured Synechococcales cyanobacterium]